MSKIQGQVELHSEFQFQQGSQSKILSQNTNVGVEGDV